MRSAAGPWSRGAAPLPYPVATCQNDVTCQPEQPTFAPVATVRAGLLSDLPYGPCDWDDLEATRGEDGLLEWSGVNTDKGPGYVPTGLLLATIRQVDANNPRLVSIRISPTTSLEFDPVKMIDTGTLPAQVCPEIGGCRWDPDPDLYVIYQIGLILEGNEPVERPNHDGFPLFCFPHAADPTTFDPLDRGNLAFLARAIDLLYHAPSDVAAHLLSRFGPDAAVSVVPDSASVIPGSAILTLNGWTLVVITGTSNFQQLAAQLCYALTGPVNLGSFSTSPTWFLASLAINARVNASPSDPAKPIIFTGHSYGGALGCLLAATYKAARPARSVQLATFGCPRPGDNRLVGLLEQTRRIHVANRGDLITCLPPTLAELGFLWNVVPPLLLSQWLVIVPTGKQLVLEEDGSALDDNSSVATLTQLAEAVGTLIPGSPLPPYTAHGITTYIGRLLASPS